MLFFKNPLDIPPPYDIVKHTFFGNSGGKMKRACAFFAEKCFAPVLCATALAFVISCQNASDGDTPDQGGSLYTITENHELQSISASASEIVAKTVKDIVDKLEFKVKYDEVIVDAENNEIGRYEGRIDNVSYANLPNELKKLIAFMVDGKSAEYEYSFPKETKEFIFYILYEGQKLGDEINLHNGNHEGQELPPTERTVKDLLKEILTEAEYNRITGDVSSNLTLTAQTIKAVGDTFSVLESDAKNGTENADRKEVKDNKEAFVARAEEKISVSKNGTTYTITYNTKVNFNGEFNLSEISLPDNNGNGDFSSATLTNNGESITIDKFNNIRGSYLPILKFTNVKDTSSSKINVYNLYKDYSNNLDNLQIYGNFGASILNGKKISGDSNYTLFTDDDKAKLSTDMSVKSLTIDALIQMYTQLKISYFANMIISGDAKEATDVAWSLTNIVFEGDMSKIKNTKDFLNGIVYFKNKVYEAPSQSINGLFKLDSLEGVSNETLGVNFSSRSSVFDVRGVDTSIINNWNTSIVIYGGYQHAIYFSDDFNSLKDNPDEIKKLCDKFTNKQKAGFINAYLGKDRVNGPSYVNAKETIGAKNPRSLKEFEYFGNNFEDNNKRKFEKSAKETYGNEFDSLPSYDQGQLNIDPYTIAQNNKRGFPGGAKRCV